MKFKYHWSSKNQNWRTPKKVYDLLDKEFNFDCDPCPVHNQEEEFIDMLKLDWGKSNYVNPPYKEIAKWLKKGYEEFLKGKTVVFNIPSRTDTQWFHEYSQKCSQVRFLKGRMKFTDDNGMNRHVAPFPSIFMIFDDQQRDKFILWDVLK